MNKLAAAAMARGRVVVTTAVAAAFAVGTFIALTPSPDVTVRAQDVLPPDQVFVYEASATAAAVILDFDINEGGYLYLDKFGFASGDPTVELGATQFPGGELHEDEFFGEQIIFRDDFRITIPYTRTAATSSFDLELRLQGCDEIIGLCYPPQRWTAAIDIPAAAPIAAVPAVGAAAGLSGSIFAGAASDEPMPVDQAFVANGRFDSANELTVGWYIAPGYYLYRDEFSFEAEGEIQFAPARLPRGQSITDQNYGDTEVFYDYVEVRVPFSRAHPDEQQLAITAGFQGCKDDSICYPPSAQLLELTLPPSAEFAGTSEPVMVAEEDRFAALVRSGPLLAVIGIFFVSGLGLSLTPCVYPMIPILSSIITGQGQISHWRSFGLSVAYVLGMAATYTVAGAVTAMAGSQVQAVFQQPWILVSVAAIFVIMAMAMFGLFEIRIPSFLQNRISAVADRQKGGSFYGTAVIGALSALIVTTCVAPPLIGILTVIAESGDVARGSLALFVLSIGMGVPLLLIGASAGQLLPRVGPWMNVIKAGFGVVMIGMAIWMLDRVLEGTVTLAMWAVLVFLTGVFLGAFDSLPENPQPIKRLAKGVGVLACLYGALMLIGATLGGEHPTRPIPSLGGLMGQTAAAQESRFVAIETVTELESLLGQARAAGQPVMVDFTADWCTSCKEMEAYTFPDPAVVAALEPFMLLRADVTDNDSDDQALMEYFGIFGPPSIRFYDRAGTDLYAYRLAGFSEADEFATHVATVANL